MYCFPSFVIVFFVRVSLRNFVQRLCLIQEYL